MSPTVVVFAYNFPHKKTQDFLLRLFLEGVPVSHVIAADPVRLNIPPPSVRTKLRYKALVHPEIVAERINAQFHVLPHNAQGTVDLLRKIRPQLGVIAGARILKKAVINAFEYGIINFHPGLIPEARGLDALLWSIYNDIPLGVTAHLIDERVDAGRILIRKNIPIYRDDTILDLSERLYESQLIMLRPAIDCVLSGAGYPLSGDSQYNRKMPAEIEREALSRLPQYILRHSDSNFE